MSSTMTFASIDADGAIQEAADSAGLDTRSDFFRKSMYAGGTLAAGGALMGFLPAIAGAATPKSDVKILNFALTLEYLEAAFYRQAINGSALTDPATLALAKIITKHEEAHVTFLKKALGSAAVKKPKFDFRDTVTDQKKFQETAFVLENTGVSAYLGQAGRIKTPGILGAAATILTIEARHSGAVAQLIGRKVSPDGSFDKPKSMSAILKAVGGTKFIVG